MTARTEDPEDAYWQAARADTARVLALYGESPVQTVIRVDDDDDRQGSDWLQREEDADARELCEPKHEGGVF